MTSSCWYCRKGGLVDLYFAGRTGVCPKCGKGVNVKFDTERFMTLDTILTGVEEWAKSAGTGGSKPNEPLTMAQLEALPDGTKVYCYQLKNGKLVPDQWEVCRTKRGNRIERNNGGYHWSNQIAIDSEDNHNNRRCFLKEVDLNGGNGSSDNKPLTTEELMQMDGQKVWCSSLYYDEERFNDQYCGWRTVHVAEERVTNDSGDSYNLNANGENYGFRAYRTDQSHRANGDSEEELPF